MKIGYISERNLELNPHLTERMKCREAAMTRRMSRRGDKVYAKLLLFPVDYEEIVDNANIMKNHSNIILTREPFLLNDELREKCIRWVEWANKVDESEYNPLERG